MIVAPLALYFYLVHPEWAWMYLVDPRVLSGLAVLPLVVGHTRSSAAAGTSPRT